jgi:soluble lytic murein transglycosylase-like protein
MKINLCCRHAVVISSVLFIFFISASVSCGPENQETAAQKMAAVGFYSKPSEVIKTISANTSSPVENYMLGMAHLSEKNYRSAFRHFSLSAFEKAPDNPPGFLTGGWRVYFSSKRGRSGYYYDALYRCAEIYSLFLRHACAAGTASLVTEKAGALYREAVLLQAASLVKTGSDSEAAELLEKYTADGSRLYANLVARIRLASIRESLKEYEKAAEQYVIIIATNPSSWQAGISAKRLRQLVKDNGVSITSASAPDIGAAYYYLKMYSDAAELLKDAGPAGDLYYMKTLIRLNRFHEAGLFVKRDGGQAGLQLAAAEEYSLTGNRNLAIAVYRDLAASGREPQASVAGEALIRLLSKAADGYNVPETGAFIKKYPDNVFTEEVTWQRGRRFIRSGDHEKAVPLFAESLKHIPEGRYSDNFRYYSVKYSDTHNNAESLLKEFSVKNPDSPYFWLMLRGMADAEDAAAAKNKFKSALDADDYQSAHLYHALLTLKGHPGFTDRVDSLDGYAPLKSDMYNKILKGIRSADTGSGPGAVLRRYFAAGDAASIRREADYIRKDADEDKERLFILASLSREYGYHFLALVSVMELLKLHEVKENIFMMPTELTSMLYPSPFRSCVSASAEKWSLSPSLLYSVARSESLFNHEAVSSAGARGIVQVMPKTGAAVAGALKMKEYSLSDPCDSFMIGGKFILDMSRSFSGTLHLKLAAYNAGPGNVRKWSSIINEPDPVAYADRVPFEETRMYILKTIKHNIYYSLDIK